MPHRSILALLGLIVVGGCGPHISREEITPIGPPGDGQLFEGRVTRSSVAYPISGGTLLVTRDGTTAVASDPDRGRVFLADLSTHAVRSVVANVSDELGRVIEGEAGRVYVVARRGGVVLRIDIATGTLLQRMAVCNAPRGLAYDSAKRQIHVACASGALVTLDPESGTVVRKIKLDDDLRDVVTSGDKLVLTRFRSAEVLLLDSTGREISRSTPPQQSSGRAGPSSLAYRATMSSNGTILVAHQASSTTVLPSGVGSYYGGNCGGSVTDTFLSVVRTYSTSLNITSNGLLGATGPLDVASSPDGQRVAVIATGNSWAVGSEKPTLGLFDGGNLQQSGCWDQSGIKLTAGEPIGVAFDAKGKYVVQFREPAKLVLETNELVREILLSDESRADTGLALFQVNASGGVACASCHPEGGTDRHVWNFSAFGNRVTQPLEAKVSERAPFHWAGDIRDWNGLIEEVMMKRMAMPVVPSEAQSAALLSWLDTIRAPLPADDLDPAAIERGHALFLDTTVGCTSCHNGPSYTNNQAIDVGTGGLFVVPSLIGVGARLPLMHNGCAPTLEARFSACGGVDRHRRTSQLTTAQIADLATYPRCL